MIYELYDKGSGLRILLNTFSILIVHRIVFTNKSTTTVVDFSLRPMEHPIRLDLIKGECTWEKRNRVGISPGSKPSKEKQTILTETRINPKHTVMSFPEYIVPTSDKI